MRGVAEELRSAVRLLRHHRGAAVTLVAVLGFTAGITTAAVDVVAAYLWRPLPYPESDRLVVLEFPREQGPGPRDLPRMDWSGLQSFSELVVASDVDVFTVLGAGTPFSTSGRWMTADAFAAFGAVPVAGRFFSADEARRGEPLAVIGHDVWQDHFGGDMSVVGRTITVRATLRQGEEETLTIVGVMPRRFWHLDDRTSLVMPLQGSGTPSALRLRPGVAITEAAARVTAMVRTQSMAGPDWTALVTPIREAHVQRIRPMLTATLWSVLLLALVAFANLAFLQMARGVARQRELAVRSVLGASTRGLLRQAVAEGLVIGGGAAIVSLVSASLLLRGGVSAIEQYFGRVIPGGADGLGSDLLLLLSTAAACLVAGALLALVMLAAARSPALHAALAGHASATDTPARQLARQAIVGSQVAVAFCLLVAAALMVRTAWHLSHVDLGFEPRGVLTANVTLHERVYRSLDQRRLFFQTLLERIERLPEVTAAGITDWLPFRVGPSFGIEPEGSARQSSIGASIQGVTPGYFAAMQMRLAEGRWLTADDRAGRGRVALVSRSLARALWDDAPAVGRTFRLRFSGANPGRPGFGPYTIVGVVDESLRSLIEATPPQVYMAFDQQPMATNAFLHIKTSGAPLAIVREVTGLLNEADPSLPLASISTLDALVDREGVRPRFLARVLAGFALLAVTIAVIGLHAVSAWIARQRQREAALRVALGANRGSVALLLARRGMMAMACGLVAGWIASTPLSAMMAAELHGVAASDWSTRLLVGAMVASVSVVALLRPVWRAATLNLASVLRAE